MASASAKQNTEFGSKGAPKSIWQSNSSANVWLSLSLTPNQVLCIWTGAGGYLLYSVGHISIALGGNWQDMSQ